MDPLAVLADDPPHEPWPVPAELEVLYGGPIGFAEQCTIANFVETIDGVVSVPDLPRSNTLISDESEGDRFVMGLLRACADVVVVGSGTLRASPQGTWRADRAYPPAARAFADLRAGRGRAEHPAVAVVTRGGSLDAAHPALESGALVLTSAAAARRLRAVLPAAAELVPFGTDDVDLPAALAFLRERYGVVLSEAGPTLFGSLLAARLVDELFLTISPLVAGRAGPGRLSLVEGVDLLPNTRVAGRLASARRAGSHLFLRYALR